MADFVLGVWREEGGGMTARRKIAEVKLLAAVGLMAVETGPCEREVSDRMMVFES
jgi:hypothetical protein